ncbi:hypothetical protein ACFL1R_05565 [Candidatus Latescibacterota bacterium]
MSKFFQRDRNVLALLIILFSIYAGFFIYKTSFVIDGERYYSLFDDAMVSMRYARNLVDGYGLVMNPGERVEGYTNFLWVLYMAAVHLLPVAQSKISIIIQITGALLLVVNLFFVRKIALLISGNNSYVASAALFLTAFYLPLINWSLQGMEVGLQTLIMSIAVWRTIISINNNKCPWGTYVLLGISTLVRIDMTVPFVGIWLFIVIVKPKLRKKNLLAGGMLLLLFLGTQTLARVLYYGDPFPNTYYLKMTGYPLFLRITRGFIVFWNFIRNMNLLLFLVPVVTIIFSYTRSRAILAIVVVLQMLYSVYVGGDAWEDLGGSNRYIAFVMPLFFALFSCGIFIIGKAGAGLCEKLTFLPNKVVLFILNYHYILLIIISFIQFNSNSGFLSMKGILMLEPPPLVTLNQSMVERALLIKRITTPEARIAVTWAGAIPYFSERYIVDMLGKTDRIIARGNMRTVSGQEKYTFFLPGHLKYDYAHSIGIEKPDAVLQFWGDLEEAELYMAGKYARLTVAGKLFYLRNGSKNILWNKFMKNKP